MEDGLDRARREDARDRVFVAHIGAYEVDAGRQRIRVPGREVVDDRDAVTRREEGTHHVRSDIPRAACNENVHGRSFSLLQIMGRKTRFRQR
jgi:hypothetical protein